ncbi:hypothetical protein LTR56_027973 [Elasticomyces elasticus]|nr:hypothetical protein LTR56_027973 [Elasticomyces elasticus]KAK3615515.1 hypothetical protein LTR22_027408 [Elasticomyces elasticus]
MRLINIHTLEFAEFYDDQIPPYAILSHRWTDDEITYADFRKGRRKDSVGYEKVLRLCEAAQRYSIWLQGSSDADPPQLMSLAELKALKVACAAMHNTRILVKFVWIDTCCIDKKSSAELSEAIKNLRTAYAHAAACHQPRNRNFFVSTSSTAVITAAMPFVDVLYFGLPKLGALECSLRTTVLADGRKILSGLGVNANIGTRSLTRNNGSQN